MSENVKNLEKACQDVLKEMKELNMSNSIAQSKIDSMKAQINVLNDEMNKLQDQKLNLKSEILVERKKEMDQIDQMKLETEKALQTAEAEKASFTRKNIEYDRMVAELTVQKEELTRKQAEIEEKNTILSAKTAEIEQFLNRVK